MPLFGLIMIINEEKRKDMLIISGSISSKTWIFSLKSEVIDQKVVDYINY